MLNQIELERIILAAHLYYREGKTQREIADSLNVSRPAVSRLLTLAREERVVDIRINDVIAANQHVSDRLKKLLAIDEVVVVPSVLGGENLSQYRLGLTAGRYLEQNLQADSVVGLGWGRSLRATVQSLQPVPKNSLKVVPLMGGLGKIAPEYQVFELARKMAENFGGQWYQLYIPAIVLDPQTRHQLLCTEDVQKVTQKWSELDTAVIGIGNMSFDNEFYSLFSSYLDADTKQFLQQAGAAGDICMRFFDRSGQAIPNALPGATGIELSQLTRIGRVIAIAGGSDKCDAIWAATRGGYITILITDEAAAMAILTKHELD